MLMEETKSDSNTGTMKTIKIAVGKIHFPTAYFFVFPGCLASGCWHSAAVPVCGRQWRIQLAKLQSSFAKSFCVFRGGNTTIPQALRASSLYTREPFSTRISGIFLSQREIVCWISQAISATGCRADDPAGGAKYLGVPHVSAACCWLGKAVTIDGEVR